MEKRKVVVAVTGMPGSGKTVACMAVAANYPILSMGDILREEAERRGIQQTPENLGRLMLNIRSEKGPAVMAERLVPKIKDAASPIVIVEGIRSLAELEELGRHFDILLTAIHASPKTRFRRLWARCRNDDPKTWEEFRERDLRELSVGLGQVLALADKMVVNEGTVMELQEEFRKIVEGLPRDGRDGS